MWINPKYADQVEQPRPPQENGKRIATFPRGNGVEMRVNLSTYQGKPFISLRLWERDQAGAWWPCKGRGCSVRLGEAAGLVEALKAALEAGRFSSEIPLVSPVGKLAPRDEAPKVVDRGRPVRAPWDAAKLAGTEPRQGFDEFGGGMNTGPPPTA